MTYLIQTISQEEQRYATIGDWQFVKANGDQLNVKVSNLGNEDSEFLIAIHELVEAYLCRKAGVTTEQVDEFDMHYDEKFGNSGIDEPGENPNAPYFMQHFAADIIERTLASFLGVNWLDHEKRCEEGGNS
jgi:hypothetical protein